MSGRIVLRAGAADDVVSIVEYISERNPDAAARFAAAVPKTLGLAAKVPFMGSPRRFRSKRLSGIRSLPVEGFRKYLVFYRPIEGGIEVLAVVHGARDLPVILRKRT